MFDGMFHTLVLFPAICALGEALFLAVDQFCKWRENRERKEEMELKWEEKLSVNFMEKKRNKELRSTHEWFQFSPLGLHTCVFWF